VPLVNHPDPRPSHTADPPLRLPPGLGPPQLLDLFRTMVLTRATEEELYRLAERGLVEGEIRRSLGQEAGAVGCASTLRRRDDGTGDVLTPSSRGLGAILMMGATPEACFRQHLGTATSPTGGRAGDLAWSDPARGILGPAGLAGTTVQVMAGVTLAFRMRGEDRVGMVFAGDGASSTGGWHEGLNFAAVRGCPMVLVVEANGWAFSTPTRKQTRNRSFLERCPGYGIQGVSVDGTNLLEICHRVAEAVERARGGEGVQMVELRTYRLAGHHRGDGQEYVSPEEIEAWRSRDPVPTTARTLRDRGWATPEEIREQENRARAQVLEAVETVLSEEGAEPRAALVRPVGGDSGREPWWRTGSSPSDAA